MDVRWFYVLFHLTRKIFTNPVTNSHMRAGDVARFPALAETYRKIAADGINTFYNGTLKNDILADLNELGKSRTLYGSE